MTPELARKLNFIYVMILGCVLLGSLTIQFVIDELPCPLCLLQRLAFLCVCVGPLLNLRYGIRPAHFGVTILAAVFGMLVSVRQILLHIVPGTGGYGTPVWGMHLYSWAFIIYLSAIGVAGLMLLFEQTFHDAWSDGIVHHDWMTKVSFLVIGGVAVIMTVAAFAECGYLECPDNPKSYWLMG